MPIVFSRLANSQKYAVYATPAKTLDGQVNTIERHIHIKGGANLADKHLFTPRGVATRISEEDAALLVHNTTWKIHAKNGHVTIEDSASESDVEKVISDMGREADASAPITPTDFQENDGVIGDGFNGEPTAETTGGGRSGSGKRNR